MWNSITFNLIKNYNISTKIFLVPPADSKTPYMSNALYFFNIFFLIMYTIKYYPIKWYFSQWDLRLIKKQRKNKKYPLSTLIQFSLQSTQQCLTAEKVKSKKSISCDKRSTRKMVWLSGANPDKNVSTRSRKSPDAIFNITFRACTQQMRENGILLWNIICARSPAPSPAHLFHFVISINT